MLGVVSNNCQIKMTGCNSNKDVKVTNRQSLANETMAYFCIVVNPIDNGQHGKGLLYFLRFLEVLLNCFTMKGTISKLSDAYL